MALRDIEPWVIQGMPTGEKAPSGKSRVYLPPHDYSVYWRFRNKPDFTAFVAKVEEQEGGGETMKFEDVAGFPRGSAEPRDDSKRHGDDVG